MRAVTRRPARASRYPLTVLALSVVLAAGLVPSAAEAQAPPDGPAAAAFVTWGGDPHLGIPETTALPDGTTLTDIAGGGSFFVGLLSDGSVRVWGDQVPSGWTADALGDTKVTAIAAGINDMMVLTEDGDLRTWGFGAAFHTLDTPAELDGETVAKFGLSDESAVALTTDGHVVAWGHSERSQNGTPMVDVNPVPDDVAQATVTDLDVSDHRAVALLSTGEVEEWGEAAEAFPTAPVGDPYTQVAIGVCTTLAVTASGAVVQRARCPFDPVPSILQGHVVTAVDTLGAGALALTADGLAVHWGHPSYPQPAPASLNGRTATAIAVAANSQAVAVLGRFTASSATISGDAAVGSTLTATSTSSPTATSTSYEWLRDGTSIAGATGSTYDVSLDDAGHSLTVRATVSKDHYDAGTAVSQPVAVPLLTMPGTAAVTLTGARLVGSLLTASPTLQGTPDPTAVTWRWERDGHLIAGSTSPTRRLTAEDRGHRVAAVATLTSAGYVPREVASRGTSTIRLQKRSYRVHTDHTRVRRGQRFVVSVARLAPGEAYRIRLAGRVLGTGHASSTGRVHRAVRMPSSTSLGRHRLTVVGWQTDRSGATMLRTLRR